ncbi:MAG: hypothetical protein AAB440_02690 [Patescibacteria group bacterium]
MIYIGATNKDGERIFSTFPESFVSPSTPSSHVGGQRYLRQAAAFGSYEILLQEEPRISNSNKVFNAFVQLTEQTLAAAVHNLSAKALELSDDYLHNIVKIHGNQKSIVERCVASAEGQPTYADFENTVREYVQTHPQETATDLCALSNEIRLVDYHIGGYNLLRGAHTRTSVREVNLKKFLLGLSHLFFQQLSKNRIMLSLHNVDEHMLCAFDYETFNVAMHGFLENTTKYAKPYSKISVFTKSGSGDLVFEMQSIRIEKNETNIILERGEYGKNVPDDLRGSGIGMYQLKKALDVSGIQFGVFPDHTTQEYVDKVPYTPNTFVFTFPKYRLGTELP